MNKTHSRCDFINGSFVGTASICTQGVGKSSGSASLNEQKKQVKRKVKIVVTGGHPGDLEYGCCDTIAQ